MLPFTRWSVRKPGPKRLAAKKISAVSLSTARWSTVSLSAVSLGAVGVIAAGALSAGTASASASTSARGSARGGQAGFTARAILSGASLRHTFVAGGKHHSAPLTLPDDITALGPVLFTAFQNGVGPQGQPSTTGNQDSTVVEFTPRGHVLRQWDIRGKCDGLTADPDTHQVIATVNEDAHSSVYTIDPWAAPAAQVRHYHYSEPLPSKGGTDAISIFHGLVLVSASAPGTTGPAAPQPSYPAVYQVTFGPAELIARIQPVFYDESKATVANPGQHGSVKLALTDPDSNEVVPWGAPRFAGDFMLTSQGDKEQIFLGQAGWGHPALSVLELSNSVDDTAWATSTHGALFAASTDAGTVDVVTGPFTPGTEFVAVTPCDANGAPATCPGPGFPPNYVGALNPWTGHISRVPVHGAVLHPQGMLFAASK